jgi:putative Holliday junction resolvase
MPVGRLLGIDHGIKRIGLAVSDATGLVAHELLVLKRKSRAEDFARLNQIAAEQQVVALVVGLPTNESVSPSGHSQADTVRLWAERLQQTTSLPIILWDEQLTSHDARQLARQQRRKPDQPIDDLAARLILQSYLDALHAGLASRPTSPEP